MPSYNNVASFHAARRCSNCTALLLQRGPKAGRESGVYLCGEQLWRVVPDPTLHLMHRLGDAVCFEEEFLLRAKERGVNLFVVYVGSEVWLADTETFERHLVSVAIYNQVGLPCRRWQRRPSSTPALQMTMALPEGVAP